MQIMAFRHRVKAETSTTCSFLSVMDRPCRMVAAALQDAQNPRTIPADRVPGAGLRRKSENLAKVKKTVDGLGDSTRLSQIRVLNYADGRVLADTGTVDAFGYVTTLRAFLVR